jgi:hypothetical protein
MKLPIFAVPLLSLYIMCASVVLGTGGCAAVPTAPGSTVTVAPTSQPATSTSNVNSTLNNIEGAIAKVQSVANVLATTPSPIEGYSAMVAALLAGGLAVERLVRTYIVKPAVVLPASTAVVTSPPPAMPGTGAVSTLLLTPAKTGTGAI